MNIFVTSSCPFECARTLDDVRVNKMVLETAQLLATAHHQLGSGTYEMYRATMMHKWKNDKITVKFTHRGAPEWAEETIYDLHH